MTAPSNKIALYIDGANLHATARTLGFEISTACREVLVSHGQ